MSLHRLLDGDRLRFRVFALCLHCFFDGDRLRLRCRAVRRRAVRSRAVVVSRYRRSSAAAATLAATTSRRRLCWRGRALARKQRSARLEPREVCCHGRDDQRQERPRAAVEQSHPGGYRPRTVSANKRERDMTAETKVSALLFLSTIGFSLSSPSERLPTTARSSPSTTGPVV